MSEPFRLAGLKILFSVPLLDDARRRSTTLDDARRCRQSLLLLSGVV
jgi:hypothetical protein